MSVRQLLAGGNFTNLDLLCKTITQSGPTPSLRGYAQAKSGTAPALLISSGEEPGTLDIHGRAGWQFIKPLADPVPATKINWFFFGGTVDIVPVSQLATMWSIITIDFFDGTTNGLPWLTYYTKPLGDGLDAEVWYRSKVDHFIPPGHVRAGERVCIWTGTTPPPAEHLYGARTIELSPALTGPAVLPTDEILYKTIHTDSSDTQVSLTVETLGFISLHESVERMYNLHLVGA